MAKRKNVRSRFCSVQTRLTALVLLLVLLPLITLSVFLMDLSRHQISSEIYRSTQASLRQAVASAEGILREVEKQAGKFVTNRELLSALSVLGDDYKSSWDVYEKLVVLYDTLAAAQETDGVSAVYLYDFGGKKVYASGCWGDRSIFAQDAGAYFDELMRSPGWVITTTLNVRPYEEIENTLAFVKSLSSRYVIVIHVPVKDFQRELQSANRAGLGTVLLLDEQEEILDGQDVSLLEEYDLDELENSDSWIICTLESGCGLWHYMGIQSANLLIAPQIDALRRTVILTMSALILFAVPCVLLLTRSIQSPVRVILDAMSRVEKGDLQAHIDQRRADEFGLIFERFNFMVDQMSLMIDRLYKRRIEQQVAEIKVLQSQIKPHFLYNTLDTVHWMARMNRTKEIADLTFMLCNFYRLVLSEGKEVVPVKDALNLAKEYLKIQQLRYNGRFDVEFDVQPEVENLMAPKLLFQPLAENAVLHGIDSKQAAKLVRITGKLDAGKAVFSVWDDGMGIPPQRLEEVRRLIASDKTRDIFALRNLYNQLKLLTGGEIEMNVDSQYGAWTCITLRFCVDVKGGSAGVQAADRRG